LWKLLPKFRRQIASGLRFAGKNRTVLFVPWRLMPTNLAKGWLDRFVIGWPMVVKVALGFPFEVRLAGDGIIDVSHNELEEFLPALDRFNRQGLIFNLSNQVIEFIRFVRLGESCTPNQNL
jgi:hypothetical protein